MPVELTEKKHSGEEGAYASDRFDRILASLLLVGLLFRGRKIIIEG